MLKELLYKSIARQVPKDRKVVLTMSGGCDSASLLFGLKELGYTFEAHHYYFRNANEDTATSVELCNRNLVPLIMHVFKENDLKDKIEYLKKNFGAKGKIGLQCLVGYYDMSQKISDSVIVNGTYAEELYGCYKVIFLNGGTKDKDIFTRNRQKALASAGLKMFCDVFTKMFAQRNNQVVFPFNDHDLMTWFMSKNFKELNPKGLKGIFFEQWKNEIYGMNYPPERRSQQITSGVRDYLKDDKEIKYK